MDLEKRVSMLETAYAGVQADAVRCFDNMGVLERITEQKKREQLALGRVQAERFGVKKAQDVFEKLSEVFNCAKWIIEKEEDGFVAESKACRLCAIAKQMSKASPCRIYCLNPMEGMVKGINPDNTFEVEETLWDGLKCRIRIEEK
jgi:hypothetical protein